jgi:hypothetical protein
VTPSGLEPATFRLVEQFPDINKLCNVACCWIYSRVYIHIDVIHTGTRAEGMVGAIPDINYKNGKYRLCRQRRRPLVTYMQDINYTCILRGTFSYICDVQSSDSVFGVERRDRASDILTHLRETEFFAGNEHRELFKTQIIPCHCNTKTQTLPEKGANWSIFLTVTGGGGIFLERLLRLCGRSYKGSHGLLPRMQYSSADKISRRSGA